MKAIWKLSGDFYGWLTEDGSFFKSTGKRFGTVVNNVLYNHKGKYVGDIINEQYIGYNVDKNFIEGPVCYTDSEIYKEPMYPIDSVTFIGYSNPV